VSVQGEPVDSEKWRVTVTTVQLKQRLALLELLEENKQFVAKLPAKPLVSVVKIRRVVGRLA
jgi:hypothetical protein